MESHDKTGEESVRDNRKIDENKDTNNSNHNFMNTNGEEANKQDDSESINTDNKVRVNSLSALIEHIKMENAKAKGEPYTPPKQMDDKKIDENKKKEKIEEKKNAEVGEETVARCPTPLQPGSYWYSKQFSNKPDQELPNSSPQEVRQVLASLTSKTKKNNANIAESDVTEVVNLEKSEEVSVEEGSEISQSYSTDTLAESSDDKAKTIDGSSTLEDIVFTETNECKTNNNVGENTDERQESEDSDHEIVLVEGKGLSSNLEGSEKLIETENDNEITSGTKDEIIAIEQDTENAVGFEIKPNDFIREEQEEIEDQLTEIMPCEFVKHEDRKIVVHSSKECVANDCMCYEAIFRQDHPLETSSLKSDTSFGTDSPAVSPKKQPRKRHGSQSTSSLSDGSLNSPTRPSPRRCRIAAKFESPLN